MKERIVTELNGNKSYLVSYDLINKKAVTTNREVVDGVLKCDQDSSDYLFVDCDECDRTISLSKCVCNADLSELYCDRCASYAD